MKYARAAEPLVVLAALALYVGSLPPSIGWWDTGEYQTVPYIAGILHPTGFPAFTIAGWLFTHAFPLGNIAWRTSLMTALAAALAAGVLVRTARMLGAAWLPTLAGAALFAVTTIVWQHATRAGVESLTLLFGASAYACAIAYDRTGRAPALIATALAAGLALATHPVSLWYLPGLAVIVVRASFTARPDKRCVLLAVAAFVAALSLYAYLPLRSAAISAAGSDPAARLLGIAGLPFWDYNHTANLGNFVRHVSGADFHAASSLSAWIDVARYPAYASAFGSIVFAQLGWIGSGAAVLGIVALVRRWPLALGLLLGAFGVIPFSMAYGVLVDAAKYDMLLVWIAALFAISGADRIGTALATRIPNAAAFPALVLAVGAVLVARPNMHFFDQRNDRNGDTVIATVRNNTPDDAIVFAGWSYVTPLGYAAYAERTLGNRVPVANVPHDRIAAYARRYHVYYLPFPENELALAGARLEPLRGTWPPLYRVVALP